MAYLPFRIPSVVICGIAFMVGCGDPDAGSGGPGASNGSNGSNGGTGDAASQCGSADDPFVVVASEANNYGFQSTLQFDVQKVAPRALLDFDWSALTENFQGHPLTATAGLDAVVLLVWSLPPDDVANKINEDAPDLNTYIQGTIQYVIEGGATSAELTDFTLFGSHVAEETLLEFLDPDVNDPSTHSYTLIAQQGTNLGQGVHMIQAFQIDLDETNTTITMDNNSTTLEWEADLGVLTPTLMPEGVPGVLVDWSQMTVHGYGGEFVPSQITEILIGRLPQSVAEIEEDFLNLEFIADDIWRADVATGTSFNLASLRHDETDDPFPGVTSTDTWVLGLLCKQCTNPTPWYITTVETCP